MAVLQADVPSCIIMGEEKVGKTVVTGYGVGAIATFAGLPDAVIPLRTVVGMKDPRFVHCVVLQDYLGAIDGAAATWKGNGRARPIVVCDDFSLAADRTVARLQESGVGGWELWGALRTQVQRIFLHAAEKRVGLILSMHTLPPKLPTAEDPELDPGRPKMPTKELSANVAKHPSQIVLLQRAPARPIHPVEFVCGMSAAPQWSTGDRYNKIPSRMYPALGEALRASGFDIPRPPEVEKLETTIAYVAETVVAGGGTMAQGINHLIQKAQELSTPPWAAQWAVIDTLGRIDILRAASNPYARLFNQSYL